MHHDAPLYFLSLVRSNAPFTDEDSWLMASLAGLAAGSSIADFTASVLDLLRHHSRFKGTRRVAMVQRLGLSNQLRTIAAAADQALNDTMGVGYSCFVNPEGSIFRLGQETMRAYRDVHQVTASYAARHMPVQRSIARIEAMGLRSGWCFGLFDGTRLAGLLFINGNADNTTQPGTTDYTILAFIARMAQVWLARSPQPSTALMHLAKGRADDYLGRVFDGARLAALFEGDMQRLTGANVRMVVDAIVPATLVSHGHVAQILARVAGMLPVQPASVALTARVEGDRLRFTMTLAAAVDQNDYRWALACSDAASIGLVVAADAGTVVVTAAYDGTTSCNYSIAT